ncbi:MAG: AraC family transcriptional regulator [Lachnospiraceae bacterium]
MFNRAGHEVISTAASWLLKNTNKKIKTIAYESGFHNVDYFCRLFKKRYQLTPSEYRCIHYEK